MSSAEKALNLLRYFPRLTLNNLARLPNDGQGKVISNSKLILQMGCNYCPFVCLQQKKMGRGRKYGFRQGYQSKGNKGRQRWPALGFEAGNSPLHVTTPAEKSYNYGYQ